jgi:hypothetical protein
MPSGGPDVVVLVTSPSPADLFTSRTRQPSSIKKVQRIERMFSSIRFSPELYCRETWIIWLSCIGLPAFKNTLRRRQAYQHAVLMGWKSLPGEAREELFKVALEIVGSAKKDTAKVAK